MKSVFLIFFGISVVLAPVQSPGYPEPAVVQSPSEWTLDIEYNQPQQITVKVPGEPAPRRFWYIILTLTNNSGPDQADFYPSCDLMTDTFEIVPAGAGIPNIVFDYIKVRHGGRYPFLEAIDFAGSRILEGKDNRKDIAIIWPDFDPAAREVNLFIAGLSNETAAVEHPVKKDSSGEAEKIYLRKTLHLKYSIAGDEKLREKAVLGFISEGWVMR